MYQSSLRKTSIIILLSCLSIFVFATKPPQKKQKPNYKIIFPQNKVNLLEISMTQSQWDSIRIDMKEKFNNDFGKGGGFPGMGRIPNGMPPNGVPPNGMSPNGMPPMPPPNFADGPPMMNFSKGEPNYVSVSVKFKAKIYPKVGFRLKGNSSLIQTWGKGVYKLPFRLDFNEFEKDKKKQKLYGFEKLSFSPAMSDKSLIREKVTADIFREAGIPTAQTAFYRIYIDFGEGKKYCGVYTLVEVIEDTMIKTQFGEQSGTPPVGNIYKPESNFTKFKKEQFEKKNNKKQADWSDIEAFLTALNSSERTTDALQWRTNLEKTFNVDHFIKWLAVNNTIVNWDTYGALPHNFYLYNSPTQKLTWIPWDHDLSLGVKMEMMGGIPLGPPEGFKPPDGFKMPEDFKPPAGFGPPMGGGMGKGTSLSMKEVGKNWPLIRYIADDVFYYAKYKQYVKDFTQNIFTPEKMNKLFEQNQALIAPFVIGKTKEEKPYSHLKNSEDFTKELEFLKQHVISRNEAVEAFLK